MQIRIYHEQRNQIDITIFKIINSMSQLQELNLALLCRINNG